jgi:two-component system chemotaxis response regulator CheB
MQIVIIDKDLQYISRLKEILEGNHKITAFHNSFEAFVYLKKSENPDIIILEVNLPGIDGFEFLEKLRGNINTESIPVIIISEYNREEDILKAKRYSVIDYLSKNEDISVITEAVNKSLEKVSHAKELENKEISFSGKLEDISIVEALQIIQMSRKTGRIHITNNKISAEICMLEGELFSASVGNEEGETALYIIFSWLEGNFTFSKIDLKNFGKNLNVKLQNALLNGTKLIDELDDTIKLIPYQRNGSSEINDDTKKSFYYNLIDNKSSIETIINRHKLNKIVAVYHFLKLESEKLCKLIDPENIAAGKKNFLEKKTKKLDILVVDDSKIMVKAIENLLKTDQEIENIYTAYSGKEALNLIKAKKPDVVTLDVNMPDMNGITTLKHIMLSNPLPVLMLSAFTTQTSDETFEALRYGAVNFHTKPVKSDKESFEAQRKQIIHKIKTAARVNVSGLQYINVKSYRRNYELPRVNAEHLIIIAAPDTSYGALLQIIPALPAKINAAVVVLHYIEKKFTDPFLNYLNKVSEVKSAVCSENEELINGRCYFISQEYYSKYVKKDHKTYIKLSKKPFSENHEHSINIGMFSAAETFGKNCMGILISGKSEDGIEGLNEIKRYGGYTIAQSPESSIIPNGSISAINHNSVLEVVAINQISNKLTNCLTAHSMSVN